MNQNGVSILTNLGSISIYSCKAGASTNKKRMLSGTINNKPYCSLSIQEQKRMKNRQNQCYLQANWEYLYYEKETVCPYFLIQPFQYYYKYIRNRYDFQSMKERVNLVPISNEFYIIISMYNKYDISNIEITYHA